MITHADIADRLKAMEAEAEKFDARQVKEIESLQEMCGSGPTLGHQFVEIPRPTGWPFPTKRFKRCTVCKLTVEVV